MRSQLPSVYQQDQSFRPCRQWLEAAEARSMSMCVFQGPSCPPDRGKITRAWAGLQSSRCSDTNSSRRNLERDVNSVIKVAGFNAPGRSVQWWKAGWQCRSARGRIASASQRMRLRQIDDVQPRRPSHVNGVSPPPYRPPGCVPDEPPISRD